MKRNPNCDRCPLGKVCHTVCLWGEGNPSTNVMLIGEAPGYEEDRTGTPFIGQAGKLLEHVLRKLGVDREDLYITNVIKCRPPDNELPGKKELMACWQGCKQYLDAEIKEVQPKIIVVLGGTPLNLMTGMTGITKHEGMVVCHRVEGKQQIPIIAAFHPAYVLRAPGKEVRLAQALARAFKLGGIKMRINKTMEIYPYEIRA
mgnify:CR=1 FL=1